MGSRVGNLCFDTNATAADAYFPAQGTQVTPGSTTYLQWFEKVGAVWQIKRQSVSSTGVITNLTASTATVPTFPACDPIGTAADLSSAFGAGFILPMGAFVAAYSIGRLIAMFNSEHG